MSTCKKNFLLPLITICFLCTVANSLTAQKDTMAITGVYYLRGVMETASVIKLKPDSSFEFFFSQGALDRGGTGKWTVKGDQIILNSSHIRPPKDYALVSSKTVAGNATVVKMVDKNTMILPYSEVILRTASGTLQQSTDSHGETHFSGKHATEISLLFRLCPDRTSVFVPDPKHNYFEFTLEPWIAEIFFNNFSLLGVGNELHGRHPLLAGNGFRYTKEE